MSIRRILIALALILFVAGGLAFAGGIVADGVIASTSGGFEFPDGTTQTTAASSGGSSLFGTPLSFYEGSSGWHSPFWFDMSSIGCSTLLQIENAGSQATDITVSFYDMDGLLLASISATSVPAGAAAQFATSTGGGPGATADGQGSLTIVSSTVPFSDLFPFGVLLSC